jgi:soluble lytic murein transglycosylase-like protein
VDRETALAGSAERVGGAVADSLRRYGPELRQAAADTGIDPALLLSVLVHESGGDPRARSPKGALGLMQLMPATARELGVTEPLRPAESIRGGARYLGQLLARFDQNPELALAGYNAGPGAVEKAGQRIPPYRETVAYVRKVMSLYERLRGEPGTDLDRDRRK